MREPSLQAWPPCSHSLGECLRLQTTSYEVRVALVGFGSASEQVKLLYVVEMCVGVKNGQTIQHADAPSRLFVNM